MLDHPSEYIESSRYFSWEQFFTRYLTEQTRDSYLRYQKSNLNPVYIHPHEKKAIVDVLPDSVKGIVSE